MRVSLVQYSTVLGVRWTMLCIGRAEPARSNRLRIRFLQAVKLIKTRTGPINRTIAINASTGVAPYAVRTQEKFA